MMNKYQHEQDLSKFFLRSNGELSTSKDQLYKCAAVNSYKEDTYTHNSWCPEMSPIGFQLSSSEINMILNIFCWCDYELVASLRGRLGGSDDSLTKLPSSFSPAPSCINDDNKQTVLKHIQGDESQRDTSICFGIRDSKPKFVSKGNIRESFQEYLVERQELNNFIRNNKQSYHLRKDVITKTILRGFRRFYVSRFRKFFAFNKACKKKNFARNRVLVDKVDEFVNTSSNLESSEGMKILLLCFVDTKITLVYLKPEQEKLRSLIYKIMYKFNKQALEEALAYPEFVGLFQHYLNQPGILEEVTKDHKDGRTKKLYCQQFRLFGELCSAESPASLKVLLNLL